MISTAARPLGRATLLRRLPGSRIYRRLLWPYLFLLQVLSPLLDRVRPTRLTPVWGGIRARLFVAPGLVPHADHQLHRDFDDTPTAVELALSPSCLMQDQTSALAVSAGLPTLVLTGAADDSIGARHSAHLARRLGSTARLVRVPDAGHMVNLIHAGAVNDALAELLQRVRHVPAHQQEKRG